jgi:hypothetical protein
MMIFYGGKFCPPDEAVNSKTGHPYLAPIVVIQPAENPKEFKPWHMLHSLITVQFAKLFKAETIMYNKKICSLLAISAARIQESIIDVSNIGRSS